MKTVKTKIVAALIALALGFSTVAVAQDFKMFYNKEVGPWTIWGHPGVKNGQLPACVLNQNDDKLGFQYVWAFLPSGNMTSMLSFQDKELALPYVGKFKQGMIELVNATTGQTQRFSVRYKAIDSTSINFEIPTDVTVPLLQSLQGSSKVTMHYDGGEFFVNLDKTFVPAVKVVADCIRTYTKKDSI